jgi:hypothetical protein
LLKASGDYSDNVAQTKANLAEITAMAYADGIVSEEETRAIEDAQAKADAAEAADKNYADSVAGAAETAAKALIPTTTTSTSAPSGSPPKGSIWRQGPQTIGGLTNQYMHYQYDGTSWVKIGGTYINGSDIITGTIDAGLVKTGVLKVDDLSTFALPTGYSGTVIDKNGMSVYENGVLRVRVGKLT